MNNIIKYLGVILLVSYAFISCEKESIESFENEDFILKSGNTTQEGVDPIFWDEGPGGNANCEDLELVNIIMTSNRINYVNGVWEFEGAEHSDYPLEGLTVTVTDGTYITWEYESEPFYDENSDKWFVRMVGAVIVKGGPAANLYYYNEDSYYGFNEETEDYVLWTSYDEGLHSPFNASSNPAGLSNLTFCIVEREYFPIPEFNETCYNWQTETAWAANGDESGSLRYTNQGNWATYLTYSGEEKTVSLFAGQTIFVGTATLSPNGDNVNIEISLEEGWELAINDYDEFGEPTEEENHETVKIEGYNNAPSGNPAPGLFSYKANDLEWTIPAYDYYGIHLDVGLLTETECQ